MLRTVITFDSFASVSVGQALVIRVLVTNLTTLLGTNYDGHLAP
jgi:hypothetical protein